MARVGCDFGFVAVVFDTVRQLHNIMVVANQIGAITRLVVGQIYI